MGKTLTHKFTNQQNRLAGLAKAIGHPARIAILEFLASRDTCYCGDIVEELPLSQSTISQHLKELKKAGLVHGTTTGVKTCYCIDVKVWEETKILIQTFFGNIQQRCC